MKRLAAIIFAITGFFCQPLAAAERILSFDSVVEVNRDGSMVVTEFIRVRAESRKIRRGIYRDFPTKYKGRYDTNYNVDFEVLAVLRNGEPEPYFTRKIRNGVRTYIGRKNVLLRPGEYTYTLKYRTDRQLGFFENHDELYWNVTGNAWAFPIDSASATVVLPDGVPVEPSGLVAYTGRQGSRGKDYRVGFNDKNQPYIAATRTLHPGEGLTIAVMWPKGHIDEPGLFTRMGWFARDNPILSYGGSGLVLLLAFYLFAWHLVGRDPQAGVIFPHYEPPEHFSPASMRFIKRMDYDHKTFATALVNLAVNGHVTIRDEDDTYTIEKHPDPDKPMAPGERKLLNKLVLGREQPLERKYHQRIAGALEAHEKSLKNNYETIYFLNNSAWFYFGILISVVILLATMFSASSSSAGTAMLGFFVVVVAGMAMGKVLLVIGPILQGFRGTSRKASVGTMGGVMGFVVSVVVLGVMGLFAYQFMGALVPDGASRIALIVFSAGLLIINGVFYQLMKAPTQAGRRLLDKIEGFEEYLAVAEEHDLRLRNPPKKTPELFERYLPYAMALDVEDIWGDKFTAVLAQARKDGTYKQPRWYRGTSFGSLSRPGAFASSVASSLAVSTAAASTAPGSSSGGGGFSGGGGSSGGGGGGGGGGGW